MGRRSHFTRLARTSSLRTKGIFIGGQKLMSSPAVAVLLVCCLAAAQGESSGGEIKALEERLSEMKAILEQKDEALRAALAARAEAGAERTQVQLKAGGEVMKLPTWEDFEKLEERVEGCEKARIDQQEWQKRMEETLAEQQRVIAELSARPISKDEAASAPGARRGRGLQSSTCGADTRSGITVRPRHPLNTPANQWTISTCDTGILYITKGADLDSPASSSGETIYIHADVETGSGNSVDNLAHAISYLQAQVLSFQTFIGRNIVHVTNAGNSLFNGHYFMFGFQDTDCRWEDNRESAWLCPCIDCTGCGDAPKLLKQGGSEADPGSLFWNLMGCSQTGRYRTSSCGSQNPADCSTWGAFDGMAGPAPTMQLLTSFANAATAAGTVATAVYAPP